MHEETLLTSWLRRYGFRLMCMWAVALPLAPTWAGGADPNDNVLIRNPHGDSASCISCHVSATGGRETLQFAGNVSQLCESCHDGRAAAREVHAAGVIPSPVMMQRIPRDFPLERGTLTCLSCHDIARDCQAKQAGTSSHNLLRGDRTHDGSAFCFQCHAREDYQPFNPHDQIEAGKPKTDTCTWCHIRVPEMDSQPREAASYELRAKSADVCRNCHVVAQGHPVASHMHATPSAQMLSYMSAREMQSSMRLPFDRLLKYARATRRAPRSIPLDEDGRITCYSCHNPHENGLMPRGNPRSLGAEPRQATNHRLRTHQGRFCEVCHQK